MNAGVTNPTFSPGSTKASSPVNQHYDHTATDNTMPGQPSTPTHERYNAKPITQSLPPATGGYNKEVAAFHEKAVANESDC